MKDIKQAINEYFWNAGSEHNEKVEKFIEEIIKPIAKEAFEAGQDFQCDKEDAPFLDTWLESKFGFTSNKQ